MKLGRPCGAPVSVSLFLCACMRACACAYACREIADEWSFGLAAVGSSEIARSQIVTGFTSRVLMPRGAGGRVCVQGEGIVYGDANNTQTIIANNGFQLGHSCQVVKRGQSCVDIDHQS